MAYQRWDNDDSVKLVEQDNRKHSRKTTHFFHFYSVNLSDSQPKTQDKSKKKEQNNTLKSNEIQQIYKVRQFVAPLIFELLHGTYSS